MTEKSLVDVVLVTYNQEKYIAQAIQSVLDQQCDFAFRLIIGEDCSTDRTREICQEFALKFSDVITLLLNNSNFGLIRNYRNVFNHCSAKYVAILEGDDFWTDRFKLKKQVALLEADCDIGLIFTGLNVLYEDGTVKNAYPGKRKAWKQYAYNSMMKGKCSKPNSITACFDRRLLMENFDFDFFVENDFKTIDGPIWFELGYHKEFMFIPDITATYRVLNNSISNDPDIKKIESFNDTSRKTLVYYFNKYPVAGYSKQKLETRSNCFLLEAYLQKKMFAEAKELSKKISLFRLKYIFLWAIANFNWLYPLFSIYTFTIRSGSTFKQAVFSSLNRIIYRVAVL